MPRSQEGGFSPPSVKQRFNFSSSNLNLHPGKIPGGSLNQCVPFVEAGTASTFLTASSPCLLQFGNVKTRRAFCNASTKKNSPHITDSSTPRPLCI
jgi:hypothetical protein